MKTGTYLPALIATLLLHAGGIVLVLFATAQPPTPAAQEKILEVRLAPQPLPVAASPSPPPPQPPPPAPEPPKSKPPKAVREPKAVKPLPAPPKPAVTANAPSVETRPAVAVAETAPAAPPAPAPAPPPIAAPVKTGPSISASYAASNRKPAYPALSRRYEEQGTVVLRLMVKADGTAGEVQIKKSSGHELLDESARSTVQTWRFNPATVDGKPVAEWYQVAIPFTLN